MLTFNRLWQLFHRLIVIHAPSRFMIIQQVNHMKKFRIQISWIQLLMILVLWLVLSLLTKFVLRKKICILAPMIWSFSLLTLWTLVVLATSLKLQECWGWPQVQRLRKEALQISWQKIKNTCQLFSLTCRCTPILLILTLARYMLQNHLLFLKMRLWMTSGRFQSLDTIMAIHRLAMAMMRLCWALQVHTLNCQAICIKHLQLVWKL